MELGYPSSTNEAHLKGELFPTEIRAVSAGIVNVTNHIPVVINMLTFPMITSAGLLHIAMYVYGGFAFLMAVWGIMTIKVWKTLESLTVRHQRCDLSFYLKSRKQMT